MFLNCACFCETPKIVCHHILVCIDLSFSSLFVAVVAAMPQKIGIYQFQVATVICWSWKSTDLRRLPTYRISWTGRISRLSEGSNRQVLDNVGSAPQTNLEMFQCKTEIRHPLKITQHSTNLRFYWNRFVYRSRECKNFFGNTKWEPWIRRVRRTVQYRVIGFHSQINWKKLRSCEKVKTRSRWMYLWKLMSNNFHNCAKKMKNHEKKNSNETYMLENHPELKFSAIKELKN